MDSIPISVTDIPNLSEAVKAITEYGNAKQNKSSERAV